MKAIYIGVLMLAACEGTGEPPLDLDDPFFGLCGNVSQRTIGDSEAVDGLGSVQTILASVPTSQPLFLRPTTVPPLPEVSDGILRIERADGGAVLVEPEADSCSAQVSVPLRFTIETDNGEFSVSERTVAELRGPGTNPFGVPEVTIQAQISRPFTGVGSPPALDIDGSPPVRVGFDAVLGSTAGSVLVVYEYESGSAVSVQGVYAFNYPGE
ncbi:MAG: hypothetical protein AAF851_06275 [Myxococcota bacterium]